MEHSRRSARMSPDDVRDIVLRARALLDCPAGHGMSEHINCDASHAEAYLVLVDLGHIRRNCSRSSLTEEAARLEDRLHALI